MQRYLNKFDYFFHSMKVIADFEFEKNRVSIALLAVHSAITLNDALQVALTGKVQNMRVILKPSKTWKSFAQKKGLKIVMASNI